MFVNSSLHYLVDPEAQRIHIEAEVFNIMCVLVELTDAESGDNEEKHVLRSRNEQEMRYGVHVEWNLFVVMKHYERKMAE